MKETLGASPVLYGGDERWRRETRQWTVEIDQIGLPGPPWQMVHVGFIGSRAKFEARAGYPIETTNSATMLATILCLRPFANQLCYLPVSSLDMPTIGMWLPQGTHASRNHKPGKTTGKSKILLSSRHANNLYRILNTTIVSEIKRLLQSHQGEDASSVYQKEVDGSCL